MDKLDYDIQLLLPHSGHAIFISKIIEFSGEAISALAIAGEGNLPKLYNGQIPNWVSIEYMAQAIAICATLKGRMEDSNLEKQVCENRSKCEKYENKAKIGFLMGVRNLSLGEHHLDCGQELLINAELNYDDGSMAQFNCSMLNYLSRYEYASATLSVYRPKEVPAPVIEGNN